MHVKLVSILNTENISKFGLMLQLSKFITSKSIKPIIVRFQHIVSTPIKIIKHL